MNTVVAVLSGVLMTGFAVAGLFFLRFWRESHDRLFGYFAGAFFVLCLQRLLLVLVAESPLLYIVRLVAFALIIIAIVEKNRAAATDHGSTT
jgi:hypothetical protein